MSERPPIKPEEVPGGGAFADGMALLDQAKAKRARGLLPPVALANERQLPPSNAPTMRVKCPKCGVEFVTRREFRPVFCVKDEPPYVGDGRGCGWMLFCEPLAGQPTAGKAHALVDCKVSAETGRGSGKARSQGFQMFAEEMNRRGLVKAAFAMDTGHMGFVTASVKELGL